MWQVSYLNGDIQVEIRYTETFRGAAGDRDINLGVISWYKIFKTMKLDEIIEGMNRVKILRTLWINVYIQIQPFLTAFLSS